MEPLHLDTLSSSCALAAVLRDAGKTQAWAVLKWCLFVAFLIKLEA